MVQPITAALGLGATPLALDASGVPHLLRGGDGMPAMPSASATESARLHLARLAPAWGLRSASKLPGLEALGEVKVRGGTVVRFRQLLDGLPIEGAAGGELRVMVRPDGSLVGASGTLRSNDTPRAAAAQLVGDDAAAVTRAVNDKYQTQLAPQMLSKSRRVAGGARVLAGTAGSINVSMSRAHQAWYPQGKTLVPAWIVEAYSSDATSTDGDAYRTVISATGRVLARVNLKADAAFQYRVFAEDTGEFHPFDGPLQDMSPNTLMYTPAALPAPVPYVTPNLVTVEGTNHPDSGAPDPWLDDGITETKGNNVEAYTDSHPPDGLTFGDYRATVTAGGVFDRTYDVTKGALASQDQQMAGITSLFYLINWMHDFWYDGGFTEPAGNGQDFNYGRGGEQRDAMLAEAQDNALGGSRNNANMSTPSDGFPGRMQVFVWDNLDHRALTSGAASYATGTAAFSPAKFSVTGNLVIAAAASGPAATTACTAIADATDKIVIADRGACSFKTKALNAQNAHAAGVVIANNAPGAAPGLGDDTSITTAITVPTLAVSQADGVALKAKAGTPATMSRNPDPDLEGTLDVTVVGHEFGHFVHHRLSVCNTSLCGAMSEGWADFSALLVSSRAGDDFDQQFPLGIYSVRGTSPEPAYYGIRRAPYSTNHAVNPLMFHHMTQGVDLPPPPFNGGPTSINNEVHNAGEVWASMLWEGYAALQKAGTSFEDTRLKMRQYVVAGLLLAPPDATPTETRDAILLAVKAASQDDHDLLAQAYARRGFGSCAKSPDDRNSVSFAGIVDSTDVKGRIATGEVAVARTSSCDNDDVLDAGEAMQIKVPISNPGPVAMTNVKATLHSALVTVDGESPTLDLGTIEAYGQATAAFIVTLDSSVTQPTESDVTLEIASDDGCETVTVPLVARFNTDDKPASSASDDFNAGSSVWTPGHVMQSADDTDELWQHVRNSGLDGLWFGIDQARPSDSNLTSPSLVAGNDPVTITFKHAFDFEFAPADGSDPEQAFDGGVIEYSVDDGETWSDISELADPGYTKTLAGTPGQSSNALAGRMAYGFENPSFPDPDTVTLDLGTALAGKTFQIRFRIGTDDASGAGGWIVDDVAVTGITNTPFPTLVADAGHCDAAPTGNNDDGGCCQAGGMTTGNLAAALGVLGLVLRRRRRRA